MLTSTIHDGGEELQVRMDILSKEKLPFASVTISDEVTGCSVTILARNVGTLDAIADACIDAATDLQRELKGVRQ